MLPDILNSAQTFMLGRKHHENHHDLYRLISMVQATDGV